METGREWEKNAFNIAYAIFSIKCCLFPHRLTDQKQNNKHDIPWNIEKKKEKKNNIQNVWFDTTHKQRITGFFASFLRWKK